MPAQPVSIVSDGEDVDIESRLEEPVAAYDAPPVAVSASQRFTDALRGASLIDSRAGMALAALSARPEDIPAMISAFENRSPGGDAFFASMMLMSAWGQHDGPGAVQYAEENLNGWQARIGSEAAMQSWTENNPEAVVDWLSVQESPELAEWYPGIIAGLTTHDLPLASDMMEGMEYGRNRGRAASKVLEAYLSRGAQNMLAYVNGTEDTKLIVGLQQKAAALLADLAPEQYVSWAFDIENEAGRAQAVNSFMRKWASDDPEKAIDYLDSRDEDSIKERAVTAVLSTWLREDMAAAAAWVSDMDPGRSRDSSLNQVATRLVREQPAVALEFALQIADGAARLNSVNRITKEWVKRDPEGAKEILGEESVRTTQASMKNSGRNNSQGHRQR